MTKFVDAQAYASTQFKRIQFKKKQSKSMEVVEKHAKSENHYLIMYIVYKQGILVARCDPKWSEDSSQSEA